MTYKVRPYERQPQVLRILLEHGPLSARGLAACLDPPVGERALRYILQRLYRHEILARRHDKVTGRVFHQIAQNPRARIWAGEILGKAPDLLKQPQFRHAELLHSENCAAWCELLRHLFPTAFVRRDYQLPTDREAQAVLLSRGEEQELMPDILLTVPIGEGRSRIAIALEIERTAKSRKRLTRKLRKYADQTRLDGLIYVCSTASLRDKLVQVYKEKIAEKSLRISHYATNFFLFADGAMSRSRSELLMFNSAMEDVSLQDWMHTLAATKAGNRRDSIFKHHSADRNDVVPLQNSDSRQIKIEKTII